MRNLILAAVAAATICTAASAEDFAFRGFRIEGNAGWDQFRSHGDRNGKFGYGGQAGFDGQIGDKIVIGPEVNYWRPNNNRNVVGYDIGGGAGVLRDSREQWGSAVRVGFLATPALLIYGKGGYVNNSQRSALVGPDGAILARGRTHVGGYQYGGGIEYTLHDRFSFAPTGLYVSAQYVRDEYNNDTSDQHAMGGIGIRFR